MAGNAEGCQGRGKERKKELEDAQALIVPKDQLVELSYTFLGVLDYRCGYTPWRLGAWSNSEVTWVPAHALTHPEVQVLSVSTHH